MSQESLQLQFQDKLVFHIVMSDPFFWDLFESINSLGEFVPDLDNRSKFAFSETLAHLEVMERESFVGDEPRDCPFGDLAIENMCTVTLRYPVMQTQVQI